jgi:hypothetical protein
MNMISDKYCIKETDVGATPKDSSLPPPLKDASNAVKRLADLFGFGERGAGCDTPATHKFHYGIIPVPMSQYMYGIHM